MKRQHLVMTAALVAVAAALFIGTAGHTAESRGQEDHPPINAVMRVDAAPLLNKIDSLQAEVILLRETVVEIAQNLQAIQKSAESMQDAMATLKQPNKWQYHILYKISKTAANSLGEEGWECVTANENYLVFRKPLLEEPQE